MSLDCTGTKLTAAIMGMLPASVSFAEAQAAVDAVTGESELFLISSDKDQQYLLLVCFREDQPKIQEALRAFSFSLSAVTGMTGTAKENIAASEKTLDELAKRERPLRRTLPLRRTSGAK